MEKENQTFQMVIENYKKLSSGSGGEYNTSTFKDVETILV